MKKHDFGTFSSSISSTYECPVIQESAFHLKNNSSSTSTDSNPYLIF